MLILMKLIVQEFETGIDSCIIVVVKDIPIGHFDYVSQTLTKNLLNTEEVTEGVVVCLC